MRASDRGVFLPSGTVANARIHHELPHNRATSRLIIPHSWEFFWELAYPFLGIVAGTRTHLLRELTRCGRPSDVRAGDEAIVRLVGALMLETNDEWTVARRYMSLESLARVTDTTTVRLSAVAT